MSRFGRDRSQQMDANDFAGDWPDYCEKKRRDRRDRPHEHEVRLPEDEAWLFEKPGSTGRRAPRRRRR